MRGVNKWQVSKPKLYWHFHSCAKLIIFTTSPAEKAGWQEDYDLGWFGNRER